ncbi:MAG: CRISPR-associated endonuclease Cas2 [bacterium]|nr:CRISPR-associated endonuclease Cas2 [bacterium]
MNGDITLKILESITGFVGGIGDFAGAFLSAGYGASYGRMRRELGKRVAEREMRAVKDFSRRQIYNAVCKLRQQGLIVSDVSQAHTRWHTTEKGLQRKVALQFRTAKQRLADSAVVKAAPRLNIVVFDIPERERRKRDWLRDVLRTLGFIMLQKSVWVGKVLLPESFIGELEKLGLLRLVEIFEISKSGTLRQVI